MTFAITDHSFNGKKFEDFLNDVRAAVGDEKIYLFLDNCRVHHTNDVATKMEELNIEPVWNVPYCF